MCGDVEILMYADDTVISTYGRDAEQVAAKLSQTMENVANQLKVSSLAMNIGKQKICMSQM